MRTFPLIAATLLCSSSILAQEVFLRPSEGPFIEAVGEAFVEVVPDEIFIAIKLRERGGGSSKVTVETQEEELKKAVVALGIDAANLTLTDAIADLDRNWFKKDDVIATKRYMLKVGDAEMVRKAFVELDKLQVYDARVSRVAYSKRKEVERDMLAKATRDAQQNAEGMVTAISQKLGAPMEVHEVADNDVEYRYGRASNTRGKAFARNADALYMVAGHSKKVDDEDLSDLGITFSRIRISALVYVKFAVVAP